MGEVWKKIEELEKKFTNIHPDVIESEYLLADRDEKTVKQVLERRSQEFIHIRNRFENQLQIEDIKNVWMESYCDEKETLKKLEKRLTNSDRQGHQQHHTNEQTELEKIMAEYDEKIGPGVISDVWFQFHGDATKVRNHLQTISSSEQKNEVDNDNHSEEEKQMQEVIELSEDQADGYIPLDILYRKNMNQLNVALRNCGNTCGINCLLQSCFQLKTFLLSILSFKAPKERDLSKLLAGQQEDEGLTARKRSSIQLVKSLQKLYAQMLFGKKTIADPEEVLKALTDPQGQPLFSGDQRDIGEVSLNLLEQIEEGLAFNIKKKKYNLMSIHDMFYGTTNETRIAHLELQEKRTKRSQESALGVITLNLEEEGFEASLKNYFNFNIEGFHHPTHGVEAKASKMIVVDQAPAVLNIVLQRVIYDKRKQRVVKLNDVYPFPLEFSFDEVLAENQQIYKKIRKIKTTIEEISANIEKIKNDININEEMLELVPKLTDYLTGIEEDTDKNLYLIKTSPPSQKSNPISVKDTMMKKKQSLITELEYFKEELNNQRKKLDKLQKEVVKVNYRIHSVVIHYGQAEGGHYYVLIFNKEENKWRKFNDNEVTDIKPHEALRLAYGEGRGDTCAYSLTYVKDDCEVISSSLESFKELEKYVSKKVMKEIMAENEKFMKEYKDFKGGKIMKLCEQYLSKSKQIEKSAFKCLKEKQKKNPPPTLPGFHVFLLASNCVKLAQWSTIKTLSIIEAVPYQILEGDTKNYYYKELRRFLLKATNYKMESLGLTKKEERLLRIKEKEFKILKECLDMLIEIAGKVQKEKLKKALEFMLNLDKKLSLIKKENHNRNFFSFSKRFFEKILLKMAQNISLQNKNRTSRTKLVSKCLFETQNIIPDPEILERVIKYLYEAFKSAQEENNEKIKDVLNEAIDGLQEFLKSQHDVKKRSDPPVNINKSNLFDKGKDELEIDDEEEDSKSLYESFVAGESSTKLKEEYKKCKRILDVRKIEEEYE